MATLTALEPYTDERGNRVEYDGPRIEKNIRIVFTGRDNVVRVSRGARIGRLVAEFDGDNGLVSLGSSSGTRGRMLFWLKIGEDCSIEVGDNVTCTNPCGMTTAEGTSITIGDDCMIATDNEIRADDGHPIFDVRTGARANPSRSIRIGRHVWIAKAAIVLAGADIGDGSVIGFRSIVKGRIPNNVIAVGVPARVVRRDIAWERPHLTMTEPRYKRDAHDVEHSAYWNTTAEEGRVSTARKLPWWRLRR